MCREGIIFVSNTVVEGQREPDAPDWESEVLGCHPFLKREESAYIRQLEHGTNNT